MNLNSPFFFLFYAKLKLYINIKILDCIIYYF